MNVALLLDTHAWIWSVEGADDRIGPRSRRLLARAESRRDIWISPATIFEIVALQTSARLSLSRPVEQWLRDALDSSGGRVAELTPAVAVDAGQIPRSALADPLDRVLAATARQLDAVFLTADARLLEYAAATASLRVHDARQ